MSSDPALGPALFSTPAPGVDLGLLPSLLLSLVLLSSEDLGDGRLSVSELLLAAPKIKRKHIRRYKQGRILHLFSLCMTKLVLK